MNKVIITWNTDSLPLNLARKIIKIHNSGEDIFDFVDPESIVMSYAITGNYTVKFSLDYYNFGNIKFEEPFEENSWYRVILGTKNTFEKTVTVVGPTKGPNWPFK